MKGSEKRWFKKIEGMSSFKKRQKNSVSKNPTDPHERGFLLPRIFRWEIITKHRGANKDEKN